MWVAKMSHHLDVHRDSRQQMDGRDGWKQISGWRWVSVEVVEVAIT